MSTNAYNSPMTTSNDTDNEAEVSSKQTMLTAQSDSVELYHALCDRSADFSKALDACRDYRKQLAEKTNEVARLRKLMNRAIAIADKSLDCLIPVFRGEHEELETELKQLKAEARLATALEEQENDWKCPHCGSTSGTYFSRIDPMGDICEDCGKAVDEEPTIYLREPTAEESKVLDKVLEELREEDRHYAPEWRELGPDEVIQEGDECRYKGEAQYEPVMDSMIGGYSELFKFFRLRTRRPLCPNNAPKQEEMPLEKELDYLTCEASSAADIHNHVLIVDCLRYLCNEIQKLKEIIST